MIVKLSESYAKHMKNFLAEWPAKTIVLGYGLNESFAGGSWLADFRQQYTDAHDSRSKRRAFADSNGDKNQRH